MTTLQKYIAAGVVVIIAILGWFAFQPKSLGATPFQQGEVYVNPAIWTNGFAAGSSQQFIVDASGNVQTSGVLSITGVSTLGIVTVANTVVATTTLGTASTLLASTLTGASQIDMTPGGASWTLTLPASSTLTSFIPTAGQVRTVYFHNATTTAAVNITIAGGTGTNLRIASTTVIVGNTTASSYGKIDFVRNSDSNISALLTVFN